MPVVRMSPGGAAVTVSDEQVDAYRSRGWRVDEAPKPKPSRRKTVSAESE